MIHLWKATDEIFPMVYNTSQSNHCRSIYQYISVRFSMVFYPFFLKKNILEKLSIDGHVGNVVPTVKFVVIKGDMDVFFLSRHIYFSRTILQQFYHNIEL